MNLRRRTIYRRLTAVAAVLGAVLGIAAVPLSSVADPSVGQLQSQLNAEQGRQQTLSASIAGLSHLISSLDAQIALVESREAAVRADLAADRAKLARVHTALVQEQWLVALLRGRLAHARVLLGRQLVSNYEQAQPNLVSVVLESSGFRDLLNRLTYLHDAQKQQQTIISVTKAAKAQADSAAARLASLQATDRQVTLATAQRVAALAGMNVLLHSREGALQKARAAQADALAASQARGAALQAEIARIQAEQAAAARAAAALAAQQQAAAASSGGGSGGGGSGGGGSASPTPAGPTYGASGGWSIPYSVVLCESGGQDLTPNSAGASGYYQIIPSTWRLFGGSGSAAYQASKSEQDSVATRIWNSGSGASNWDCSKIVGIH
jgi:septal ring factor EnvC (AmiA/AmiB activator)